MTRHALPALPPDRAALFPEAELPDGADLVAEGRRAARTHRVGASAFLAHHGVDSEIAFKERQAEAGVIMRHAQVGYRDPGRTRDAFRAIHDRLAAAGYGVDRYGICLDWCMGYPPDRRAGMPRGTGLILEDTEAFVRLTKDVPVAPHFGDFVMGTPAALDNTAAALAAGATAIGNLGQYFTYRLPHWDDDVATTAETVKALALAAAQPVDILIHSNLDDGFAALFHDLACCLGAVLLEQHIVEGLIGGRIGHCYGHTFSDPATRFAFQRALARVANGPGSMVYGNTTSYGADEAESYAALAAYLTVDILAQRTRPTGHAVNPVPVTEAKRIPEVDEIVAAHLFANRLIDRSDGLDALLDPAAAEKEAETLVAGGHRFREAVLQGLAQGGVDTANPFEMLLALRRIGARRLEELYGPGAPEPSAPRGRTPLVPATTIAELERSAEASVGALAPADRDAIRGAGLVGCVATTDVHEYGKLLVDGVLGRLNVGLIDAGVSTDAAVLADAARAGAADFIALSTYNGVALDYLTELKANMARSGLDVPVFIGGKLNRVPEGSNTSLPVDVRAELVAAGAVVCTRVEDMLDRLAGLARSRDRR
ncbi:MAG: cobalamin-dependent protein [Alphaproteobacteria bacterium]|nr:cobalamin-dependent protein [Alphaproteobacteria bacterium]